MRLEADVGKSEIDALETFGPGVSKRPRLTLAADKGKMESNERVRCSCCKDGFVTFFFFSC